MTAVSTAKKVCLMSLALVICFVVAGSISALAVPPAQVLRVTVNQTLVGKCCYSWTDKIKVSEPATLQPVVVTFSTDYQTKDAFYAGLSVNGRPCSFYGAGSIRPWFDSETATWDTVSFQWVVYPSDGLVQGVNTLTLCGGGAFHNDDTMNLGFRTLAARLGQ